MPASNTWNRFIYALWAPVYDLLVDAPALRRARKQALDVLALQPGEEVVLIGIGTGADFDFLPEGVIASGIDLSPSMLARAERKLPIPGREISLLQGDAARLPYADQSFDAAILTLILSVAADPDAALREALRVTRPGGRLLVFDKFLPKGSRPSLIRRLLTILVRPFGTDLSRSFEALSSHLAVEVIKDQPVLFKGQYRAILLRRPEVG